MNQKGFSPIIILLVAAAILIVGGVWYYEARQFIPSQTQNYIGESGSIPTGTLDAGSSSVTTASTTSTPPLPNAASTTTSLVSAVSTSSWLTYTDPQDRFSFQYPPDYQIDTSTYKNILLLNSFGIRIYHKPSSQSILDFWTSVNDSIVLSSTPMTVNGYPAIYIVGEEPPGGGGDQEGTSDLLVVDNSTLVVDFFPSPFDALSDNSDPIPETILNSLRF